MEIKFSTKAPEQVDTIVVGIEDGRKLTISAQDFDAKTHGSISRAVKTGTFTGKLAQLSEIIAPAGLDQDRVVLLGLGKSLDELGCQKLGGTIVGCLNSAKSKVAAIYLDSDNADEAAQIALGVKLGAYKFDKYITKKTKPIATA